MTTKYEFVEELVAGRSRTFPKVLEVIAEMFPFATDVYLIGTAIQIAYQRDQRGATEFCDPYDRTKEAPWKHRAFCMRGKRYDPMQIVSVRDSTAIKNYVRWARDRGYDLDGYKQATKAIEKGRNNASLQHDPRPQIVYSSDVPRRKSGKGVPVGGFAG